MLTLAAAVCLALTASADDLNFLTFTTIEGEAQNLPIAGGITITFEDGQLIARSADSIFQTPVSNMLSMAFTSIAVGINSAATDASPVSIYTTDGRLVKRCAEANGALNELPAGVYLVSTKGQTNKTIVK